MRAPLALALGALAAASLARASPSSPPLRLRGRGTCELLRVDRARTPSRVCMQCHDGSAATAVGFTRFSGEAGADHPVTVDYGLAEARAPGRYVAVPALPRTIPLPGGKVECTSCHDPASPLPKWVVDEPRLCQACHQL